MIDGPFGSMRKFMLITLGREEEDIEVLWWEVSITLEKVRAGKLVIMLTTLF